MRYWFAKKLLVEWIEPLCDFLWCQVADDIVCLVNEKAKLISPVGELVWTNPERFL